MVLNVIGAKRFFDPVGIVFLKATAVEQCRGQISPGVVDVHHQVDVGTDCLARSTDAHFFLSGREPTDFDLYRAKSLLHPRRNFLSQMLRTFTLEVVSAACISRNFVHRPGAEISIQRQLRRTRIQIPERDIKDTEGAHHRTGAPMEEHLAVHLLPQTFDTLTILSK